jgi:invasion protein IalB
MTHKMRSTFVMSASTIARAAIAGALLSAAIISGAPAAAAEDRGRAQNTTPEMPQLIYSPWAKFCGKRNEPGAKEVCFTGKDAHTEAGQSVVAAALIEPEGEQGKLFRVTLPSQLQLQYGTRLIIDKEPPISGTFSSCSANGCTADYEATPELVSKLKKGELLQMQATNLAAATISFRLPLVTAVGTALREPMRGHRPTQSYSRSNKKRSERSGGAFDPFGGQHRIYATLSGHAPPDSVGESLRVISRPRWVGSDQPPKLTSESRRSLLAIRARPGAFWASVTASPSQTA